MDSGRLRHVDPARPRKSQASEDPDDLVEVRLTLQLIADNAMVRDMNKEYSDEVRRSK